MKLFVQHIVLQNGTRICAIAGESSSGVWFFSRGDWTRLSPGGFLLEQQEF